ncbi:MAG: DUF6293 family protein [Methanomicrobiales archaeon]|jgi:hypothetical protein|nr:DUF6293 family protein [Methanomicrobiales archaeon]
MEGLEETVHIVPLGYEFDRAVKPFEHVKVNRVYLVTIDPGRYTGPDAVRKNAKQEFFDMKVTEALTGMGIEVRLVRVDMFDVLSVLQCISSLIIAERVQGNRVFLNMSACGRLTSVAATLAAMAHHVTAYYVWADRYAESPDEEHDHGLSISDGTKIRMLENLHIARPDDVSEIILAELSRHEGGLTTDEILAFLHQRGVEGYDVDFRLLDTSARRRHQINYLMRLNKGILTRLERDGHVVRRRVGRHTIVTVTGSGKYLASISGMIPPSTSSQRGPEV